MIPTAAVTEAPRGKIRAGTRLLGSTYRLQLNRSFTFRDALGLVGYLQELGITDCYASPILKARSGSLHGYDVTNPGAINPEIGDESDLRKWSEALRGRGMGLIADIVPNHMGVGDPGNVWWMDVLENGPTSRYARFFDINWHPLKRELTDKVLLPILGDQYGRVLENQQIQIAYQNGAFVAHYSNLVFPVAPRTWPLILAPALPEIKQKYRETDTRVIELESILSGLGHLPPRAESDARKIEEGMREKEVLKGRLSFLGSSFPDFLDALKRRLLELNGKKGDPSSFDDLEKLLAGQAYRLSYWKVAADEVNYRRFFDLNDLAAIRVEDPEVFSEVHRVIINLVEQGLITGLRVDHVDGLYDPEGYLTELQRRCRQAAGPDSSSPFPIIVEKILARTEKLRATWPVYGTTGYDFLRMLNGLFVYPGGVRMARRSYTRFTGADQRFSNVARRCKKLIMQTALSSEIHMLAARLDRISEQHRWSRDFTLESLRFALAEFLASLPVYRTYIRPGKPSVEEEDEATINFAINAAKRFNPAIDESLFDFIGSVLLLRDPEGISDRARSARREFVLKLQQIMGTITAKSIEDTAFYRHYPLSSVNEVGSDPEHPDVRPGEFHAFNADRLKSWPHSLSASTTHDTKRSEDVRARMNVLSEMPIQWHRAILRWRRMNREQKSELHGEELPDANEEFLFYQTLVGAYPVMPMDARASRAFVDRMGEYMIKAMREARIHTSWVTPNKEFESALSRFVRQTLSPRDNDFLNDFRNFQHRVARCGMMNSLSQVLIKVASPGVPDFYPGTELWNLSLVDPDNRRPVDFGLHARMLFSMLRSGRLPSILASDLINAPDDGRIKLYVTWKALEFRKAHLDLFSKGAYLPLKPTGQRKDHVIAFARASDNRAVIVAAGRFFLRLGEAWPPVGSDVWRDTVLPIEQIDGSVFRDVFTGAMISLKGRRVGSIAVADTFSRLPVAFLERIR